MSVFLNGLDGSSAVLPEVPLREGGGAYYCSLEFSPQVNQPICEGNRMKFSMEVSLTCYPPGNKYGIWLKSEEGASCTGGRITLSLDTPPEGISYDDYPVDPSLVTFEVECVGFCCKNGDGSEKSYDACMQDSGIWHCGEPISGSPWNAGAGVGYCPCCTEFKPLCSEAVREEHSFEWGLTATVSDGAALYISIAGTLYCGTTAPGWARLYCNYDNDGNETCMYEYVRHRLVGDCSACTGGCEPLGSLNATHAGYVCDCAYTRGISTCADNPAP